MDLHALYPLFFLTPTYLVVGHAHLSTHLTSRFSIVLLRSASFLFLRYCDAIFFCDIIGKLLALLPGDDVPSGPAPSIFPIDGLCLLESVTCISQKCLCLGELHAQGEGGVDGPNGSAVEARRAVWEASTLKQNTSY